MKVAYFDCFAGVAGDMTLGALIDLGVAPRLIEDAVRSLGVGGFSLAVSRVDRCNLGGVKVDVTLEAAQPERHLADLVAILDRGGSLSPGARDRAKAVFTKLTEAEARAHRVAVEDVHLHEVGALDAIVDVVGTVVGLEALGIERVICSPVVVGRGMTHGGHGPIPVPGPATIELLRGAPVRPGPVEAEMTTPTGAALVATLAASFGPMPAMRILGAGYGAGGRDHESIPNLLRIVIGEAGEDAAATTATATAAVGSGTAVVIEANLDDLSPQVFGYAATRLLEAGALDVWTVAATMKKGRPGHVLAVLAPAERKDALVALLFRETTTIGVRFAAVDRVMLARRFDPVETGHGRVRIKVASDGEAVLNAVPEYEDCAAIASTTGLPLKEVQALAIEAWRKARADFRS